jgi:hypothetical protein
MQKRRQKDSEAGEVKIEKVIPHPYLKQNRVLELGKREEVVEPSVFFPDLDLSGGTVRRREFTELTLKQDGRIPDIVSTIGITEAAFSPAELGYFISRAPQTLRRGARGTAVILNRAGEFSVMFITSAYIGVSFYCDELKIDTKWEAGYNVTFVVPGKPVLDTIESN